nr:gamma-glutamylcyclotransferase 2-3 isoform X1 [Tanacetum cinerariifolium]
MWVFGYGSLIWKAGFHYDDRLVGFIKDYRRVFYQGSTDHRGTPEYPGRTVTLEPAQGERCWGAAYKISRKEDQQVALTYLEVREKQNCNILSIVPIWHVPLDNHSLLTHHDLKHNSTLPIYEVQSVKV